jgi:hypothetical protein
MKLTIHEAALRCSGTADTFMLTFSHDCPADAVATDEMISGMFSDMFGRPIKAAMERLDPVGPDDCGMVNVSLFWEHGSGEPHLSRVKLWVVREESA